MCSPRRPGYWDKHMAFVPKGFLRYHVLKLLSENPLSGSELIEKIEEQSEGRWAPRPGSIYPLLSLLQDYGYIKEITKDETGKKPYQITDEGKKVLEEQENKREQYREANMGFFGPLMFNHICSDNNSSQTSEIKKNVNRVFMSMFKLRKELFKNKTGELLEKFNSLLKDIADKMEDELQKV
jgi:DNA-binding PadR family transcriptional regulator